MGRTQITSSYTALVPAGLPYYTQFISCSEARVIKFPMNVSTAVLTVLYLRALRTERIDFYSVLEDRDTLQEARVIISESRNLR